MRKRLPTGWRQFALLWLALAAIGSGAALLVYGSALGGLRDSARHSLLDTAQVAARAVDPVRHAALRKPGDESSEMYASLSSDLVRIVGTVGDVTRLTTVRRTDQGLVTVLSASRTMKSDRVSGTFLGPAPSLPKEAATAWRNGTVATTEGPVPSGSGAVQIAFVPIFAPDRSVNSILVVETDYAPLAERVASLQRSLWICLLGVFAASVVFAWTLASPSGTPLPRPGEAFDLSPNRRVWITLGLLVASVAVVSDGTLGFLSIAASNEAARNASTALRHSTEVQEQMAEPQSPGWTRRLEEAADYFDASGDAWLASRIERYERAALTDNDLGPARASLLSAIRLTDARARGDLWEAGNDIQVENSQQSFRLLTTVMLGIVALGLMGAVSLRERKLKSAIDEHVVARRHYEMLMGAVPVGLFAYRGGEVLFTNGTWADRHGPGTGDVFEAVNPFDREELLVQLRRSEQERTAFSLPVKVTTGAEDRHYEAIGAPVLNDSGEFAHVLVFCSDITPIVTVRDEVQRKARELDEKNHQLSAALRHIEHTLHTIVETMVRAVEIKDPYTAGHSERVRQYSVWMGEHVGLSRYEMRILSFGAMIHDVGKIGIPDQILTKPNGLTPEEFEAVKLHTVYGAKIVSDIEMFRDCVPIVRWHHERLDGSGYPDGLSGDQIPFLARLVAVADVFDAMTSVRSYRIGMTRDSALETMQEEVSAGRLDPVAFEALKASIARYGLIPEQASVRHGQAA